MQVAKYLEGKPTWYQRNVCFLTLRYKNMWSSKWERIWTRSLVSYCCIPTYIYKYKRKHNQRWFTTSVNERTRFFIKICISHTLFSERLMFLWCVRDGWGELYSERELLPIFSSGSQRVPTLAPTCKLVRDASARLRVPRSTSILCTLSKSHCVVVITWSPSGYTPVVPECPDRAAIFLFTNQNVTACQSTQGH